MPPAGLPGGDFAYLPHYNHRTSDYLAAAVPLGLQVRRCAEPGQPRPVVGPQARHPDAPPAHPADIWSLQQWCPAAADAVFRDAPMAIVWHFQLGS
jgi:hypothetical protein